MASGNADQGLKKLQAFSQTRLLGAHVPYVIEAFPEQNQSHLSAESGLYCRIFTEGMFGIRPTYFKSFECSPQLPAGWGQMSLRKIKAFGQIWNLEVKRKGKKLNVCVTNGVDEVISEAVLPPGRIHKIDIY